MSNYLNNLIVRTLRLAPLVQPRLASVFEPRLPTGSAAPIATREVETESDPAPGEPIFRSAQLPPALPLGKQGSLAPPATFHDATPEQERESTETSFPSNTRRFSPSFSAGPTSGSAPPDISAERDSPDSNLVKIETGQVLDDQKRSRELETGPSPKEFGEFEFVSANDRAQSDSRPKTSSSASVFPPTSRHQERQEDGSGLLVRSFKTQAPASAGQPQTIRVTIKRVDVKAVFPPAIARPNRAERAAAMSLDEYLKQQSGGHT